MVLNATTTFNIGLWKKKKRLLSPDPTVERCKKIYIYVILHLCTYKNISKTLETHSYIYCHFTDTLKQRKNVVAPCELYHYDILLNTDVDIYPLPGLFVSAHVHWVDCSTHATWALQKLHQMCHSVILSELISLPWCLLHSRRSLAGPLETTCLALRSNW